MTRAVSSAAALARLDASLTETTSPPSPPVVVLTPSPLTEAQPLTPLGWTTEPQLPLVQTPLSQTRQVLGGRVLRTVDDPQVLPAPTLHRRLHRAAHPSTDEVIRLGHHAFAASVGELLPPAGR